MKIAILTIVTAMAFAGAFIGGLVFGRKLEREAYYEYSPVPTFGALYQDNYPECGYGYTPSEKKAKSAKK
jgi:hypothetical protein